MQRDQASGSRHQTTTLVAAGSKIKGHITGKASVVVEGEVNGHLKIDSDVVVGASGIVKGEVKASSVRVSGKIIGNVEGAERVEILKDGSLEGDVSSPRVIIVDGAFFKGKVEMGGDPVPAIKPASSATTVSQKTISS